MTLPTVLRVDDLRVVIWPNDHAPAHVHIFSAEAEAKIELREASPYPRLVENRRMKPADLAKALGTVREHRTLLIEKWREIHG
ncbi:MAG: DUF4160 domain-containing protein [Steroidobacteraceae bacterium]